MPKQKSTSAGAIAAAALAIVERDGLEALSMRAVAGELGMGTMSLYRYVADRAELETLIVDRVLAGLDLTVPEYGPWAEKAAPLALRLRAAALAHPNTIPLLLARRHAAATAVSWTAAMRGVLDGAGFQEERLVIAFATLTAFIFGALQTEASENAQATFEAGLGLVLRGIRTG